MKDIPGGEQSNKEGKAPELTKEDEFKAESSHPKFPKLKEILLTHFSSTEDDTRVIIFSTFRNSVSEIVDYLNRFRPDIRAAEFKGQSGGGGRRSSGVRRVSGAGKETPKGPAPKRARTSTTPSLPPTPSTPTPPTPAPPNPNRTTQKKQLATIQQFKDGVYNVLVSTSVGEEGLDIGEVDLTVLFDAPSSSTRLVQRCGRTGRKRQGKIVVLVTEGKEEREWRGVEMYEDSERKKKRVSGQMGGSSGFQKNLPFSKSPHMVPFSTRNHCEMLAVPVDQEPYDPSIYKPKRKSKAKEPKEPKDPNKPAPKKRSGAKKVPKIVERLVGRAAVDEAAAPVDDHRHDEEYILLHLTLPTAAQRRLEMGNLMTRLTFAMESCLQAKAEISDAKALFSKQPRKKAKLKDPKTYPPAKKEEERCGAEDSFGVGFAFDDSPSQHRNPSTFDIGLDFTSNSPPPEERVDQRQSPQRSPPRQTFDLGFGFDSPSPQHSSEAQERAGLDPGFFFGDSPSPDNPVDPGTAPSTFHPGFDFMDAETVPTYKSDDDDLILRTPTPPRKTGRPLVHRNQEITDDEDSKFSISPVI